MAAWTICSASSLGQPDVLLGHVRHRLADGLLYGGGLGGRGGGQGVGRGQEASSEAHERGTGRNRRERGCVPSPVSCRQHHTFDRT